MNNNGVFKLIAIMLLAAVLLASILLIPRDTKKDGNEQRSSSLHTVTEDLGDIITEEFHDSNDNVVIAADKHYAIVKKTLKNGVVVKEEYLDEDGNPIKQTQGYYAIEYEFEDNVCRQIYLGIDGPIETTNGFGILEQRTDDHGRVISERYFNKAGEPIESKYWGYGRVITYNENGLPAEISYIDENGNILLAGVGYAIVKRTFYESGQDKGKIECEFYFDVNRKPVTLVHGENGIRKEYDHLGRVRQITYIDSRGDPIESKEGYTSVERTFYPSDEVRTEMYFDKDGYPIALTQGQYGILYENKGITYLDADGEKLFGLSNFLLTNPVCIILICLGLVIISAICGRKVNFLLLVFYLLFIFYITLISRTETDSRTAVTIFWSYKQFISSPELRMEILDNIWMFIPLGAFLYKIYNKIWVGFIPIGISVFIEMAQFYTGLGLAEIDDVISNTIGGSIGLFFGFINDYTSLFSLRKKEI